MKKVNKAMLGFGALLFAGSASAGLLNGGITIHVSNIFEYASTDFNGNGLVDIVGEVLGGVGNVQSITTGGGSPLWTSGEGGNELTFVFDGYTAGTIVPPVGFLPGVVAFTGGSVQFYLDSAQNFDASGGPGGGAIASASDGTFFMELLGASGILSNAIDPNGPFGTTLFSTLSALTAPFTGSGHGYLELNLASLGLAGTFYDDNGQIGANGEMNDFLLESSFNAVEGGNAGWAVAGTASITGVPEPGSLALMGLGMLGMGFAARKRG